MIRLRKWLSSVPIRNPLHAQQAVILQLLVFFFLLATLVGVPISFLATSEIDRIVGLVSFIVQAVSLIIAFILIRRGYFYPSVIVLVLSVIGAAVLNMVPVGIEGSRAAFLILGLPLIFGGMFGGRRVLIFAAVMSILLVIAIAWLEVAAPQFVGYNPDTFDPLYTTVIFIFIVLLFGAILDFFYHSLYTALAQANQRERELDALRLALEQQVQERTASLQATVDQLQQSQVTISQLGAPILPVLPGVLVTPLIGFFDTQRAADLNTKVLNEIAQQRADVVIFDITGIEVMDTVTISELMRIATAARLLGAESILVGVRPEAAMAMAQLQIDIAAQRVFPNLQSAVAALQTR